MTAIGINSQKRELKLNFRLSHAKPQQTNAQTNIKYIIVIACQLCWYTIQTKETPKMTNGQHYVTIPGIF